MSDKDGGRQLTATRRPRVQDRMLWTSPSWLSLRWTM